MRNIARPKSCLVIGSTTCGCARPNNLSPETSSAIHPFAFLLSLLRSDMGLFNKAKSTAQQAARGDSSDGAAAAGVSDANAQKTSKGFKLFGSKKADNAASVAETGAMRRRASQDQQQQQQPAPLVPSYARPRAIAAQDVVGTSRKPFVLYHSLRPILSSGRFCGQPAEDWNGILDFADMLCTSEQASKDAAESVASIKGTIIALTVCHTQGTAQGVQARLVSGSRKSC